MSYAKYRLEYLDTMLYLMEGGYIDAVTASAQYWADFEKLDEVLSRGITLE